MPYEQLDAVVDVLLERHPLPARPTFEFSHDNAGNAWMIAGDGVDLPAIVEEARGRGPVEAPEDRS